MKKLTKAELKVARAERARHIENARRLRALAEKAQAKLDAQARERG